METRDLELDQKGLEVLEQVGALKKASETLKTVTQACSTTPEEVGSWITIIGKAILSVFK